MHPLPSLNRVISLGHWQRAKLKTSIQESVLSALRASESASSTKTIWLPNGMSTPSAILESYMETIRAKRALKRASKKLLTATKKERKSK